MKPNFVESALACMLLFPMTVVGQALDAAFTYQGQLKQSGAPLNGTADFEFNLFNASSGGVVVGGTNAVNNVSVADGLFTVSLNFGAPAFNGDQRWLEIAVRSPAGSGNFTTLAPRQPLTAAPYALYALSGPGSGGPWVVNGNNVFNTNTGNVGIGTTTPTHTLHVGASGPALALQDNDGNATQVGYVSLRNTNNTETGWMGFGDPTNPHLGIVNARSGGNIALLPFSGNVGIGTTGPAAKLDVRGDIRLGASGQFHAPAGEEKLRIIRGLIDLSGVVLDGSGFTVSKFATGRYRITYNTPFSGLSTVTATAAVGLAYPTTFAEIMQGDATHQDVTMIQRSDGSLIDAGFTFIAVGPR
jgi:hypothetical protein